MPSPGELARCGFLDTGAAAVALDQLPRQVQQATLASLASAADPDAALAAFLRFAQTHSHSAVLTDAPKVDALIRVLGGSPVLVEHFIRHPDDAEVPAVALASTGEWDTENIRGLLATAVIGIAERAEAIAAARAEYRRILIGVISRDLAQAQDIEVTWRQLSDLADAMLAAMLRVAQQLLKVQDSRLGIIALGKCGAQELNYVSDVDVVFVIPHESGDDAHESLAVATRLATTVIELCAEPSIEGALWQVDPNLRPEGKRGALVRTLDSYLDYYRRWAQPWEFQALLKARAVCGNASIAEEFVAQTREFVWTAAGDPAYLAQARELRRRAEDEIDGDASRELKLGPGGLRDVEFSVQLLQLVHGRDDESLRVTGTVAGARALAAGGYIGREDAQALEDTYRFLRAMEHRLQLRRLQRTHTLPSADADLRWLGRGLGFTGDPAQQLHARWRNVAIDARRRHEKLFYRPLLDIYARLEPGAAALSPAAARDRLTMLGFADPDNALRHVQALAQGVSRRAAIQRTLLPILLSWLADSPMPDAGLLAFRRVSEALGDSHWYLRTLRDEPATAQRLIGILGSSRWLTELLLRSPEFVATLGDDAALQSRPADEVNAEFKLAASRSSDLNDGVMAVRALRRRELLRIGAADLVGLLDVDAVGAELTVVMQATIDATLALAIARWEREHASPLPTSLAVIALGRFGGAELGYGSDADVLFVHEPHAGIDEPEATNAALEVVANLRAALSAPSPEPVIDLDVDLRPEGRNGPLMRTIASYATYFESWSAPWEAQAMLRARACAGDSAVGARLIGVLNSVRWPQAGFSDDHVREVRRVKARVEAERLPRGLDPSEHLKLGPGGLSDVEWSVQLLQLKYAGAHPELQMTGTLASLSAARACGILAGTDEVALATAWRSCTVLRNRMVLLTGRSTDTLPRDRDELAVLAQACGSASVDELRDEHQRARRRARSVFERVFYGR